MKELVQIILSDYKQYDEKMRKTHFIIYLLFGITSFQSVFIYRIAYYLNKKNIPFLHSLLTKLNMVINNIEISSYSEIGRGFFIAHSNGIVIGKNVKIGNNVTLFHDVTLGALTPFDGKECMPKINDNVTVYSGAKILGDIEVGDNCKIGANVLLFKSVLPNHKVTIKVSNNFSEIKRK